MDERVNSNRGHETTDASARAVITFAVGLFVFIVAAMVIVWVTFTYFVKHQGLGPPASPFENTRKLPPPGVPVLESSPRWEYKTYFDRQQQELETYGWVDRKAGVVRLPIDRAMDLLIQRGLPVQKAQPQTVIQPGTIPQYTVPKGYTPEH